MRLVAMALSMIVATTSLTPRVVLRMPAMPAQKAPVSMATRIRSGIWRGAGRATCAPTTAVAIAARRYWPSTPMLKRFIRKPTATASAAR